MRALMKCLGFLMVGMVMSNCTAVSTQSQRQSERPSVNLEAERARLYVPSPAIVSSEKSATVDVVLPTWPTTELVRNGDSVYVVASQAPNASAQQLVPVYRFPAQDTERHAASH